MAGAHNEMDHRELLKEAGEALTQAHRRVEAEKLAFAMVERGKIPAFSSYDQFQDKVASLLQKDLKVVEEAINLDGSLADFGKVAEDATGGNAGDLTTAFYHRLAGE